MEQSCLFLAEYIVHAAFKSGFPFLFFQSSDNRFMISTILFLSFTSSTAASANPPAFARCASWLMLLASPASLRIVSASCLFNRGMTSAETTACRTYSLTRNPASPARFLMA